MKRHDIEQRFNRICQKAKKANKRAKFERFHIMKDYNKYGTLRSIGIYDYTNKKFSVTDLLDYMIETHLSHMEKIIESPPKPKRFLTNC